MRGMTERPPLKRPFLRKKGEKGLDWMNSGRLPFTDSGRTVNAQRRSKKRGKGEKTGFLFACLFRGDRLKQLPSEGRKGRRRRKGWCRSLQTEKGSDAYVVEEKKEGRGKRAPGAKDSIQSFYTFLTSRGGRADFEPVVKGGKRKRGGQSCL